MSVEYVNILLLPSVSIEETEDANHGEKKLSKYERNSRFCVKANFVVLSLIEGQKNTS